MTGDTNLEAWIGRSTTSSDIVTPAMLDGFLAMLDHEIPAKPDDAAPQGIHWLCAMPRVRARDIGPDGHAHLGLLLPLVNLPRRMWAGSAIDFHRPIRLGDTIERQSTIRAITPKTGSAGPLVFVEVDHAIRANGEPALNERHTIVYRGPPDLERRAGSEEKTTDPAGPASFSRTVRPDPVLLFRYSALTFNSHRIHYDHPYVTGVEGYPGLVVHGPLIATLLLDLAARHLGGNVLKHFSFRGHAPAFGDEALELSAHVAGSDATFRAMSGDGRLIAAAAGTF
jgi:3-methylfumaryl-CoA hydratase